jgi:hypothetical protein
VQNSSRLLSDDEWEHDLIESVVDTENISSDTENQISYLMEQGMLRLGNNRYRVPKEKAKEKRKAAKKEKQKQRKLKKK